MRLEKWHGLGNDYLLVERAELPLPPTPDRVPPICDYHLRLGPLVETHEHFPKRTNVQLVRVDGPHQLTVGVWERGAGETLSSGTSAVAASAAAVARGWCDSPVTVHLTGGELTVELQSGRARLTGPAEEICRVELAEEFAL